MNLIANNTTTLAYSKVGTEIIVLSMKVSDYKVSFILTIDGVETRHNKSYSVIALAYEKYIGEALAKG